MIHEKVKEHLDEYIHQEVYVQISIIMGKEKKTIKSAINKYLSSNHFKDFSDGKPYDNFIGGLRDKCLSKLIDSPMRDKQTDDEIIKGLQKKLNDLNKEELKDTYWEIETGIFLDGKQIRELEQERDQMVKKLKLKNNEVYEILIGFCKKYEELCVKKYPEAPLPLKILKLTS